MLIGSELLLREEECEARPLLQSSSREIPTIFWPLVQVLCSQGATLVAILRRGSCLLFWALRSLARGDSGSRVCGEDETEAAPRSSLKPTICTGAGAHGNARLC